MLNEFISVYGLFESFPPEQQEQIRKACLKSGKAIEALMSEGILELAARINGSVGDAEPPRREAA